ncbi:PPR3A phosphatase, partial [Amia calva]|nr:PPR3A phosphatase [Amia calva]
MSGWSNSSFLTIPGEAHLAAGAKDERAAQGDNNSAGLEDEDDEEAASHWSLLPRSSPVPRKRGMSIYEETADYLRAPLASPSRRVSFADSSGEDLVEVKLFTKFDSFEDEEPPGEEAACGIGPHLCVYTVLPDLSVPSAAALLENLRASKVEVESLAAVPEEPLAMLGLVRVLNISYHKSVYVRCTMDGWRTYFDHLADYVPGSYDGETDQFSFKLAFAQPYLHDGARAEFVVRYETAQGDFWANNGGRNYAAVLKVSVVDHLGPGLGTEEKRPKSILKATAQRYRTEYDDEAAGGELEGGEGGLGSTETARDVLKPVGMHPEIEIDIEVNKAMPSLSPEFNVDLHSAFTEVTPTHSPLLLESPMSSFEENQGLTTSPSKQHPSHTDSPKPPQSPVEMPQRLGGSLKQEKLTLKDLNDRITSIFVNPSLHVKGTPIKGMGEDKKSATLLSQSYPARAFNPDHKMSVISTVPLYTESNGSPLQTLPVHPESTPGDPGKGGPKEEEEATMEGEAGWDAHASAEKDPDNAGTKSWREEKGFQKGLVQEGYQHFSAEGHWISADLISSGPQDQAVLKKTPCPQMDSGRIVPQDERTKMAEMNEESCQARGEEVPELMASCVWQPPVKGLDSTGEHQPTSMREEHLFTPATPHPQARKPGLVLGDKELTTVFTEDGGKKMAHGDSTKVWEMDLASDPVYIERGLPVQAKPRLVSPEGACGGFPLSTGTEDTERALEDRPGEDRPGKDRTEEFRSDRQPTLFHPTDLPTRETLQPEHKHQSESYHTEPAPETQTRLNQALTRSFTFLVFCICMAMSLSHPGIFLFVGMYLLSLYL